MAEKQVTLTSEGKRKLEEELEYLKTVKRNEITENIKVALSYGDLSENSEYDEARNEQSKVENRIVEIEGILRNAVVIEENDLNSDVVQVGAKVKLRDVEFNEVEEYQIVGSTEADPAMGSISDESPVGKAILGRSRGEIVDVETPGGVIRFEILEISR